MNQSINQSVNQKVGIHQQTASHTRTGYVCYKKTKKKTQLKFPSERNVCARISSFIQKGMPDS